MAVAGGGIPSMLVTLAGVQLVEGSTMIRQREVVTDTPDAAWTALLTQGETFLRLQGNNLVQLRGLHADWAKNAVTLADDDD